MWGYAEHLEFWALFDLQMTSEVKSDLRFEICRLDNPCHYGSKVSKLIFLTNATGRRRKEAKTDLLTCMASPQVKIDVALFLSRRSASRRTFIASRLDDARRSRHERDAERTQLLLGECLEQETFIRYWFTFHTHSPFIHSCGRSGVFNV